MQTTQQTAQQIFDTVVTNLSKQGCRSFELGRCLYRGPNGTKCAVGWLIPDNLYATWMDESGSELTNIMSDSRFPQELKIILEPHFGLLKALQSMHDLFDPKYWNSQFEVIAADWDLAYFPSERK